MTTHKFYWIDAFTETPFAGNPCAVVFDTDNFSDTEMQKITNEMNLSETAFIRKSSKADFAARYFTPVGEIPLAGHPTIATVYSLIQNGEIALSDSSKKITLELKAGVIEVEISRSINNLPLITMTQLKPKFLSNHQADVIAKIFGLNVTDFMDDVPIQTVSTGAQQLMIGVKNKKCLGRIKVDVERYHAYKQKSDFFSPHLFCLEGATSNGHTFADHPGIAPETFDDPFTGSATGGMAAFLWHYNLIKSPKFIAEQGHNLGRPGHAEVEVIGPRHDIANVRVGGTAVEIIRGEIRRP